VFIINVNAVKIDSQGKVKLLAITLIRTVIIYITLIVSQRIMGKRQLGELAPYELVVAVLISDLASVPLQDTDTPLIFGLIPVLTLISLEVLISWATLKSPRLRIFISGKPSIIISDGKIDQKEMRKNRLTIDELTVEMRKQNILDISDIRYAILESDGTLSIILYAGQSPLTPNQAHITVDEVQYPITVISDGRIMSDNLEKLGYDIKWLQNHLSSRKITDAKDVFLMQADRNGKIYFEKRENPQ